MNKIFIFLSIFIFIKTAASGETVEIGKGRNVIFLGVTKMYMQPDDEWILILEYETLNPLSDNKELRGESKALWPILDKMFMPTEYKHVVLKASEPHTGAISVFSSFSIVLEKGEDNCWREMKTKELYTSSDCLNK